MKGPKAKEVEEKLEIHGDKRIDEFFWMKNHPEDKDVMEHLKKENDFVSKALDSKVKDELYRELKGRKIPNESSVPAKDGKYYYYVRFEKDKEYAIHCRKEGKDGDEVIILDENELAEGKEYFSLGSLEVSPNDELMAYSCDTDGSEIYTFSFKNLKTGEEFKDKLENSYYGLSWYKDNKTVLYTVLDDSQRPYAVMQYTLGESKEEGPRKIYEVDNAEYFAGVETSSDQAYLFLSSYGSVTNETMYVPSDDISKKPQIILPKKRGVEYFPEHKDGQFFMLINDSHPNFRLISLPVGETNLNQAKEVIDASNDCFLDEGTYFKDFFVIESKVKGLNQINLYRYNGEKFHSLEFPDDVYSAHLFENYEWEGQVVRYKYSSLKTAPQTLEYEVQTKKTNVLKVKEVPNFNSEDYECKRLWAKSHDGKVIPLSILKKKGNEGPSPLVLYGYGAYGVNIDPSFDDEILPLVERGFVYAIAHVRGSATLGRTWYLDGKFFNKKNSFLDFQAAAECLVEEGLTKRGEICLSGGSAGGLLVCATMNLCPDLYKGVIGDVPFVDVVTTMLDKNLPLTQMEYEEWGNPEEKDYYEYIKSYSPYDNIEKRNYPHVLLTAGLNDPRVTYWEPMKFVSRLRKLRTDDRHSLLYTNLDGGHAGASGRYEALKEISLQYTFILKIFNKSLSPS